MREKTGRRKCEDALSVAELVESFLTACPKARPGELVELWRHWEMVMGPELSSFARPLGLRGSTLLIGAEDNVALQELSFLREDLLERVNAFLEQVQFDSIHLSLLQGREGLDRIFAKPADNGHRHAGCSAYVQTAAGPAPGPLGHLDIPPETPLGRIYWKYVNRFGKRGAAPVQP
ncbi:MAG: DUF721 domain-containing protein [Desulfovibrionaceae bacterium]|nr:DUF721 domain-containing protein [Desulfovibrionaceae bacterium]